MSIVIKEIILADDIQQFMEKVNFNFDQLMLAGGGPPGPIGPGGPIGPAGPLGNPGNKWYVGCTGTTSAIGVTTPYNGDLFLYKGVGSGCTGSTYPLGQVYEWDTIAFEFEDTGLNLRGPTGGTGGTGENIGWTIFRGNTAGSVWKPENIANVTGSTSDYVFLTGDIDGAPALQTGFSKDTLYLGGQYTSLNTTTQWPLGRQPKLIVNPRTTSTIQSATYWDSSIAIGGKGGGGISLGWESVNTSSPPVAQPNYSNIFIDELRNLHIANFTDWNGANNSGSGQPNAGINIEAVQNIKLFGGGYTHTATSGIIQAGVDLDFQTGGATTASERTGILLSTTPVGTGGRVRIENGPLGQFTVGGGGEGIYDTVSGMLPEISFFNGKGVDTNDAYRIVMTSGSTYAAGSSVGGGNTGQSLPFISVGNVTSGGTQYIGFGSKLSAASPYNDLSVTDKKVLLGNPFTDFGSTFSSLPNYSLDAIGKLRMRTGAVTDYILASEDVDGTGIWKNPSTVGAWSLEEYCLTSMISLSDPFTYPSTAKSTTINSGAYRRYSRMDIATWVGGSSSPSPADATGASADLFFGSYGLDASGNQLLPAFSISHDYRDTHSVGELSFMTHDTLLMCATDQTQRSANASGSKRIAGFSQEGQFQLANDNASTATIGNIKYNNRIVVQPLNTIAPDIMLAANNTTLLEYNSGPRIKISQGGGSSDTPDNGSISSTNLTVVRSFSASSSADDSGAMDIRFQGVGKAETIGQTAITNSFSGIPGASGGAAVQMIPDIVGATSVNYFDETEVPGRTNDYYEITDKEFYLCDARMQFITEDSSNLQIKSTNMQYAQWGTAGDPWWSALSIGGQANFFNFNGSNTTGTMSSMQKPANTEMQTTLTNINDVSPSMPNTSSAYWSNWISPSSAIRITPENPNQPGQDRNGRMLIDFNIDIGWWLSQTNTISSSLATSNPLAWGLMNGFGTVGDPQTIWPSGSVGANSDNYKFMKSVKLQSFRVKINTDYLGISETLAFNKPTRRGNMETGQAGSGASAYAFTTDWYPGVSKPMQGINASKQDQQESNRTYFSSSANVSTYEQYAYPWSAYGTAKDIPVEARFDTAGSYANAIRPFANMNFNPTYAWQGTGNGQGPLTDKLTNAYSGSGFSPNWEHTWNAFTTNKLDISGHYQVGNWMWRVCAGYADDEVDSYENASYIEFVYMPPNPWSYNSGLVPIVNMGTAAGQPGGQYDTNSTQFGLPIKFITQQMRYSGRLDEPFDWHPAALAEWHRNDAFYKSTGLSFSGQAYVSLQHRTSDGTSVQNQA